MKPEEVDVPGVGVLLLVDSARSRDSLLEDVRGEAAQRELAGKLWTLDEVARLRAANVSVDDARKLAEVKRVFYGSEVLTAGRPGVKPEAAPTELLPPHEEKADSARTKRRKDHGHGLNTGGGAYAVARKP